MRFGSFVSGVSAVLCRVIEVIEGSLYSHFGRIFVMHSGTS